jgi:hypothetical protein
VAARVEITPQRPDCVAEQAFCADVGHRGIAENGARIGRDLARSKDDPSIPLLSLRWTSLAKRACVWLRTPSLTGSLLSPRQRRWASAGFGWWRRAVAPARSNWDCPQIEGMPFGWWAHLRRKYLNSPRRASPRFGCRRQIKPRTTSRWATILDQKGSVATWFGKKDELISLIGAAHDAQMQVYADFVIDHCSGVAVSILRGRTRLTAGTRDHIIDSRLTRS